MAQQKNILKTYTWNSPSLITRIDTREQSNGETVAYLHAVDDETHIEELQHLQQLFKAKGWVGSSDSYNDKPVLRLTGLKNAQELISLLEEDQKSKASPYIVGDSLITQGDNDKDKPKNLLETIKMHSSRGSGIFYTLGNAFYIISGVSRNKASGKKDWGQIGTGLAFSSGDLLLALVGGKDDNRQFKSLLKKLAHHWNEQGIGIPEDSAINRETAQGSNTFSEKTYDFVHENINKIKSLAEVVGGFMYFNAGREQKNPWKQATAVIFTLGFGSALLIPEKKPDPEKLKNAGFLQKAWAFVQEKPLRIAGWSGLSNTLFTTIGALKERAKMDGSHHYKYDLAAASSMLVGNNLYALSSKSTGGNITTDDLVKDVYGLAAQVLNQLPPDKREAAIQTTVDFLGDRTEIKDPREQVDLNLRAEMLRHTHHNPWFKTATEIPASIPAEPTRKWEQFTKPVGVQRSWEDLLQPAGHEENLTHFQPTR